MEKENRFGFGDVLIYSLLLVFSMKAVGLISTSWTAINHFSLFVLIYLIVVFVIDLIISVAEAVIKKRDE